jgi:hypothetical protein
LQPTNCRPRLGLPTAAGRMTTPVTRRQIPGCRTPLHHRRFPPRPTRVVRRQGRRRWPGDSCRRRIPVGRRARGGNPGMRPASRRPLSRWRRVVFPPHRIGSPESRANVKPPVEERLLPPVRNGLLRDVIGRHPRGATLWRGPPRASRGAGVPDHVIPAASFPPRGSEFAIPATRLSARQPKDAEVPPPPARHCLGGVPSPARSSARRAGVPGGRGGRRAPRQGSAPTRPGPAGPPNPELPPPRAKLCEQRALLNQRTKRDPFFRAAPRAATSSFRGMAAHRCSTRRWSARRAAARRTPPFPPCPRPSSPRPSAPLLDDHSPLSALLVSQSTNPLTRAPRLLSHLPARTSTPHSGNGVPPLATPAQVRDLPPSHPQPSVRAATVRLVGRPVGRQRAGDGNPPPLHCRLSTSAVARGLPGTA